MNVGTIICLVLAGFFGIIAVIFALLKEKGAMLISGFNVLSKEEREQYDKGKLSIDVRNSFFGWGGILFLGAILSHFVNRYFAIISIAIWAILLFRDIHFNSQKAFNKYRKPEDM